MTVQRYGNNLRFLKNRNTANTKDVYRSMIEEYINSYGVDCVYYRRGYTFYQKDQSKVTADPIYGADPTAPYTVKANLVVFMEMMADSYLLNRFGIQSEAETQAYIGIRSFVERFKPLIGKEIQKNYDIPVSGNIKSRVVSGILNTDEIYGEVKGILPDKLSETSATLTGMVFTPLARPRDLLFKKSLVYDIGNCSASMFSATLNIDSVTGKVSGIATGSINHNANFANDQSSNYEIRPQVGDLLVLDNQDGEIQDKYEITRVDRRAQGSNLIYNPLLDAYCYIVTCVQHRDSYEDVKIEHEIKDDPESVFNPPDGLFNQNELNSDNSGISTQADKIQDFSDSEFNYEDNDEKDDAYGGYSQ